MLESFMKEFRWQCKNKNGVNDNWILNTKQEILKDFEFSFLVHLYLNEHEKFYRPNYKA